MYKIIFILIILLKFSSLKAEISLFFFVNSAVEKNPKINAERENLKSKIKDNLFEQIIK